MPPSTTTNVRFACGSIVVVLTLWAAWNLAADNHFAEPVRRGLFDRCPGSGVHVYTTSVLGDSLAIVASLITGGARLMLAMAESEVNLRGGTFAFYDTDSFAIVARPKGPSDVANLTDGARSRKTNDCGRCGRLRSMANERPGRAGTRR